MRGFAGEEERGECGGGGGGCEVCGERGIEGGGGPGPGRVVGRRGVALDIDYLGAGESVVPDLTVDLGREVGEEGECCGGVGGLGGWHCDWWLSERKSIVCRGATKAVVLDGVQCVWVS